MTLPATPTRARRSSSYAIDEAILIPVHPAAQTFPSYGQKDRQELNRSIKVDGLQEAITLFREDDCVWLLDGRNRLASCAEVGVKPRFRWYDGHDPYGFVRRANLIRRNLSSSQRAAIAAKLLSADQTQAEGAAEADVSQAGISQATFVMAHAPQLLDEVIAGKLGLSTAYKLTRKKVSNEPSSPPAPSLSALAALLLNVEALIGNRSAVDAGREEAAKADDVPAERLDRLRGFCEGVLAVRLGPKSA